MEQHICNIEMICILSFVFEFYHVKSAFLRRFVLKAIGQIKSISAGGGE